MDYPAFNLFISNHVPYIHRYPIDIFWYPLWYTRIYPSISIYLSIDILLLIPLNILSYPLWYPITYPWISKNLSFHIPWYPDTYPEISFHLSLDILSIYPAWFSILILLPPWPQVPQPPRHSAGEAKQDCADTINRYNHLEFLVDCFFFGRVIMISDHLNFPGDWSFWVCFINWMFLSIVPFRGAGVYKAHTVCELQERQ